VTLAVDSSSPAINASGYLGAQAESQASNSFSPPAGSVITVTSWAGNGYQGDWAAGYPEITDSLATHLTWNLVDAAYSNALTTLSTRVALWWAYAAAAPGSMTATVSESATSGQYIAAMAVAVKVWDEADTAAPIGATAFANAATGASVAPTLTPTVLGSALLIAGGVQKSGAGAITAGAGMYLADSSLVFTQFPNAQAWYGTSGGPALTTALTGQALTLTEAASETWQYIAYEVVPAAAAASGPAPYCTQYGGYY
jgi:hypothetical protein